MQRDPAINVGIGILGGLLTAGVSAYSLTRLPTIEIANTYLNLNVVLFVVFLGAATVFILHSRTAYARVLGVFLLVAGTGTIGGVAVVRGIVAEAAVFLIISGAVAGIVSYGVRRTSADTEILLYRSIKFLALFLYVFGLIYLVAVVTVAGGLDFGVEFVVLTAVVALVVKGCTAEVDAAGT